MNNINENLSPLAVLNWEQFDPIVLNWVHIRLRCYLSAGVRASLSCARLGGTGGSFRRSWALSRWTRSRPTSTSARARWTPTTRSSCWRSSTFCWTIRSALVPQLQYCGPEPPSSVAAATESTKKKPRRRVRWRPPAAAADMCCAFQGCCACRPEVPWVQDEVRCVLCVVHKIRQQIAPNCGVVWHRKWLPVLCRARLLGRFECGAGSDSCAPRWAGDARKLTFASRHVNSSDSQQNGEAGGGAHGSAGVIGGWCAAVISAFAVQVL